MTDDLAARWSALVETVSRELQRAGRADGVVVLNDPLTLQLRARRPLSDARWEWVTVHLRRDEVLQRTPEELAKEFARTYYACT